MNNRIINFAKRAKMTRQEFFEEMTAAYAVMCSEELFQREPMEIMTQETVMTDAHKIVVHSMRVPVDVNITVGQKGAVE